jgi:4-amino-4-deoxy-L-arabinose transferase-like glycosyltransferase
MFKKVIWISLFFCAVHIILSQLFPLTADESYYWLWSKHLALSYVDHPPMVAIFNFIFTGGQANLFLLRLAPAIICSLIGILIYFIAKEIWDENIALYSMILFQIVPHFMIIWITMFVELPLALFWTASLLVLVLIVKDNKPNLWYLFAVLVGMGTLSKYTMFLVWPCLALYFIITPSVRHLLKQKEPYLSFLLSLAIFSPVIYWNAQHASVSFTFHAAKAFSDRLGVNILPFFADQLVHFTPLLIFFLIGSYRYALKRGELPKLLFSFSSLPLLLILLASIKIKIWAHWPVVGYLPALPLMVAYIVESKRSIQKQLVFFLMLLLLTMAILFWASPGVLLHQAGYARNYQLANTIPKNIKIFARTNVSASLLEFYTKRPTYLATGFMKPGTLWGEKQYAFWGIPDLKKGESVLYFGEDNPDIRQKALQHFSKIEETNYRLFLVEDYINNYKMLKLEGFKGNSGHP